jgi:hypothetical protein
VPAHFSVDQSQAEVDRKAEAFVKDYFKGRGKDREAARELLLDRVSKRCDPHSVAVRKILEERRR